MTYLLGAIHMTIILHDHDKSLLALRATIMFTLENIAGDRDAGCAAGYPTHTDHGPVFANTEPWLFALLCTNKLK